MLGGNPHQRGSGSYRARLAPVRTAGGGGEGVGGGAGGEIMPGRPACVMTK